MTPPRRPISAVIIIIFALIGGSFNLGAWEQTGIASWYGGIFQGRKTANGGQLKNGSVRGRFFMGGRSA